MDYLADMPSLDLSQLIYCYYNKIYFSNETKIKIKLVIFVFNNMGTKVIEIEQRY